MEFLQQIMNMMPAINQNYTADILDHASLLSTSWIIRIKECRKHFITALKRGERVDEISQKIHEIDNMMNEYQGLPLPPIVIEKIMGYELFLYKIVMTDDTINKLIEEKIEEERINDIYEELGKNLEKMWDNGDSEEEIKQMIYEVFVDLYKKEYDEQQIDSLAEEYFLSMTVNKNVRVHLSKTEIEALKKETFKSEESEACGTCLEDFKKGEESIVLHCNGKHRYHPDCIIPWLKKSPLCPTCRTDLRTEPRNECSCIHSQHYEEEDDEETGYSDMSSSDEMPGLEEDN